MSEAPDPLETIEIEPSDALHSSVIWLHGLGASGDDFVPLVPALQLPHTRFVFPHAPTRPVTINMGHVMRAWYDITSLAPSDTREPESDIRATALQVEALIEKERARGVPQGKILLAGFSQGGAMALHVGLRQPEALAGVMVLSAYALLSDRVAEQAHDAQAQTPFLFAHGSLDPVVPIARGRDAHQRVAARYPDNANLSWHDYPMAHQVCPPQVEDIRAWLHMHLK